MLDPKGLAAAKRAETDAYWTGKDATAEAITAYLAAAQPGWRPTGLKYAFGDRVTKPKGSSWTGRVVGFYSTALNPVGYCVESENEPGSVQIYPEAALSPLPAAPAEGER